MVRSIAASSFKNPPPFSSQQSMWPTWAVYFCSLPTGFVFMHSIFLSSLSFYLFILWKLFIFWQCEHKKCTMSRKIWYRARKRAQTQNERERESGWYSSKKSEIETRKERRNIWANQPCQFVRIHTRSTHTAQVTIGYMADSKQKTEH